MTRRAGKLGCCREGVGDGRIQKPRRVPNRTGRLLQHLSVRVYLNEPAVRTDRRRVAEAYGEVQLLAEQQDQVGLCQHLGHRPEAGVVGAPRAFHEQDRHAGRLFHRCQSIPFGPSHRGGTGQYQRFFCLRYSIEDLANRRCVEVV